VLADRARRLRYLDALFVVAIAIALQLECWLDSGGSRLPAALAAGAIAAAVATRRRWPALALVIGATVLSLQSLAGGALGQGSGVPVLLSLAVLAYVVGSALEDAHGLATLALAALAFAGFDAYASSSPSSALGAELFICLVVLGAPWFVGRLARRRRLRTAAFAALAAQAEVEREQRLRQAIAAERSRIGRELQDVTAHSVSGMIVLSAGARAALRRDPERAREAILRVEETGREALADLRRMLGVLRNDEDPRALAPQPGLGQLATLISASVAAGLECELHEEGESVALTPGLDLVAYRVLEAALLEAARRPRTCVAVTLRWFRALLELDVSGDGPPLDHGEALIAMRERLHLYDGSLEADSGGREGFAVLARLPLPVRGTS
jgi:signal transduction histidine kinase